MSDRRGLSLIELTVVMLIVSILAAIAQPRFHEVRVRARAVNAVADMEVLRVAVLSYQTDQQSWPADAAQGVVPSGLEEYLPGGFDFDKGDYVLDYDNWGGIPFDIGVTLVTSDSELGLTLLDMLPPPKWWSSGDKYSWVIE